MRLFQCLAYVLALWAVALPVSAQNSVEPVIPNFWDPRERLVKPSLQDRQRLRFLTTTDFPPFSYVDQEKRLAGFHVALALAICDELGLTAVCQIQALPFAELEQALNRGEGDAIMAGLAITDQSRTKLAFSHRYFRLPARFITRREGGLQPPLVNALAQKTVGVVNGTAHAAYARAHFGDVHLRLFDSLNSAMAALEKDQVSAVFGDGLALSFWLQAKGDKACCALTGDPHLAEDYFGRGLAVAVGKQDLELLDGINYAIRAINNKGIFAELYLRYFPISLY